MNIREKKGGRQARRILGVASGLAMGMWRNLGVLALLPLVCANEMLESDAVALRSLAEVRQWASCLLRACPAVTRCWHAGMAPGGLGPVHTLLRLARREM